MLSFRLDKKTEKELNYIKLALNGSQTSVVKEAIHVYYETLVTTETPKAAADIFMNSGYIGSFKAEEDLSINYKEKLAEGLERKHGFE